ncbi:unnamed protein product, partial [Musa textilis]
CPSLTQTTTSSSSPWRRSSSTRCRATSPPSSISFSLDGRLISYLFSPDGTLDRKVFAFDVAWRRQELVFSPPDGGGLDESDLSAEEKLRRERALGLKLPSCAGSAIIDPHLSPDGIMLAYVKDDELHVLSLSLGKPKQLTFVARTSGKMRYMLLV